MNEEELIITEEVNQGEQQQEADPIANAPDERLLAEVLKRYPHLQQTQTPQSAQDEPSEWEKERADIMAKAAMQAKKEVFGSLKPSLVDQCLQDIRDSFGNTKVDEAFMKDLRKDFMSADAERLVDMRGNGGHLLYAKSKLADLFMGGKASLRKKEEAVQPAEFAGGPAKSQLNQSMLAEKANAEKRLGVKFTDEEWASVYKEDR